MKKKIIFAQPLATLLCKAPRVARRATRCLRYGCISIAVVAMAGRHPAYADGGGGTAGWTPLAVDIWALGSTNANAVAFPPRGWGVAGLSLGGLQFGMDRSIYGVQLNLLAGSAKSMHGVQAGLLNCAEGGCVVQSGVINALYSDGVGLGLQVGVFNGMAEFHSDQEGFGLQAGVFNLMDDCNVVQLGLFNFANRGGRALQVGFYNGPLLICSSGLYSEGGVQVGVFNYTIDGKCLQIGFINTADRSRCFQIGLLNFHDNIITPFLGWSF